MSEYKPNLAEGEIIVCFKEPMTSKYFVEGYMACLGYFVIGSYDFLNNIPYLIKVPQGEEDQICELLSQDEENIEWTERRDLKFEKRYSSLEKLVQKSQDLLDSCEISDDDYNKELLNIIDYITEISKH